MSMIKDVAAKAGVSPSTVSLVLNNKPGISADTRELVIRTAQEMGYSTERPQRPAARTAKMRSIQFILYKKHGQIVADTPFFTYLLEGVQQQARKHGMSLLISYINESGNVEAQLQSVLDTGCAGLLLLATEMDEKDITPFVRCGLPLVVVDKWVKKHDVDSVLMNNCQGAYAAVEYLIKSGFSEIGYLQSSVKISNFAERSIGYHKALADYAHADNAAYCFEIGSTAESAYADMKKIIESGKALPQAFFADNDVLALGALRALREAGKQVPEEVSLIGFDDVPMCELSTPTLTSIRVEKEYIGRMAVDRLAERIENPHQPSVHIEVNNRLIARDSVKNS